jgi:large subunit ribosomal protein L10
MDRASKEQLVAELKADLAEAKSLIVTTSSGLDANTVVELRSKFRSENVRYRVVKNTLVKLALKGTDMEAVADLFSGPTAMAYSSEDAVSPAKVIKEFAKENEKKFTIIGAYLDGSVLDADGVKALAEMPTKDELQAQLLGLFQAVPSKFLSVLEAAPKDFLGVLKAKADKDEEGGAAAA